MLSEALVQQVLDVLIGVNPMVVQQTFGRDDERRLFSGYARKVDPVGVATAVHVQVGQVFREITAEVGVAQWAHQQPP